MADDKTAAERAAEAFYPSSEHPGHPGVERERLILREAFRSGAAWAADRRVAPDRETLAMAIFAADPDNEGIGYSEAAASEFGTILAWAEKAEAMAGALLASGVLGTPADEQSINTSK